MTAAMTREQARPAPTLEFHCPRCGGEALEENRRRTGWSYTSVLRCQTFGCGFGFVVRVDVAAMHETDPDGEVDTGLHCGTQAGAQRHYRAGEELCEACRTAWNGACAKRKRERKAS